MSPLAGWRLPLRLARREALRSRGRSLLVLAMVALPVLGVTAADVVIATQDVSSVEGLDRRLGQASASVTAQLGREVVQAPDPDDYTAWAEEADDLATAEQVSAALGGARLVPLRRGSVAVATERGRTDAEVLEVDLRDPVARGLARLAEGRLPVARGEVVVNAALGAKGYAVGDTLDLDDEERSDPVVVGVAESTEVRDRPFAMAPVGTLGLERDAWAPQSRSWLVAGGEVTWEEVRALNALGATALSRAVVLDPPPLPDEVAQGTGGPDDAAIAVVVLVVVMALLEVVLLAGPAFAVGARRQSRSLALMAATGGTPRQARRVVLAGALVLGGAASVLGVLLGIGAARLAVPLLQPMSGSWFGPFDVPWWHLLGIAAFGLVSAVLAALVPAWIASRQDVVAVLAGRRGDRRPSLRSPVLGLLLLGAGVALAAYGAVGGAGGGASGSYLIAASAIVCVLGMVLLVPVVLVGLARVSGRLPLVLRYAVRDAARHRTRTVPAVAAVAATVAGVVALGIATSSDEAQNEGTYQAALADGAAVVTWYGEARWDAARAVVAREVPSAEVAEVRGVGVAEGFVEVRLRRAGRSRDPLLSSWGSPLGADVLTDASAIGLLPAPPGDDLDAVDAALASGRLVVFSDTGAPAATEVLVRARTWDDAGQQAGPPVRATLDALVVPVEPSWTGPQALVGEDLAAELGLPVATVGLALRGPALDAEQEEAVTEGLAGLSDSASVYVERGYRADADTAILQAVLAGLGAVLMLGGTLTATFLALSDARPDLATLAAVGAAPRTRRGVAAAYAVVVGVVGAALGAVVGFVPGLAITYPLTSTTWLPESAGVPTHFVDVPWLLVGGLVLVLPLLTAGVVGLAARSRLPLATRLE